MGRGLVGGPDRAVRHPIVVEGRLGRLIGSPDPLIDRLAGGQAHDPGAGIGRKRPDHGAIVGRVGEIAVLILPRDVAVRIVCVNRAGLLAAGAAVADRGIHLLRRREERRDAVNIGGISRSHLRIKIPCGISYTNPIGLALHIAIRHVWIFGCSSSNAII